MADLTVERAQQAVDTYLRALAEQDLDAIVGLYADDATVEDPVGSDVHRGKEAIANFYKGAVAVPIEARLTGPLRVVGDAVAFPFYAAVQANGERFKTEIIDVFRFNSEGKVRSMQAFWGPANSSRGPAE